MKVCVEKTILVSMFDYICDTEEMIESEWGYGRPTWKQLAKRNEMPLLFYKLQKILEENEGNI